MAQRSGCGSVALDRDIDREGCGEMAETKTKRRPATRADRSQSVIDALHKFADTVDRSLPPRVGRASRREELTDSAVEMAQRLARGQFDLLRKLADSAEKSQTGSDGAQ